MQENISAVPGGQINKFQVEDLNDFDNGEIRRILLESEFVQEGDIITPEDYEVIKSRSEVLLSQSEQPISAKAAIMAAYVDRMELVGKIGFENLKNLPVESLQAILYVETKDMYTEEELTLFKESPLALDEWVKGRSEAKAGLN